MRGFGQILGYLPFKKIQLFHRLFYREPTRQKYTRETQKSSPKQQQQKFGKMFVIY